MKAANVPQKGDMASLARQKTAPCFIKQKAWCKLHVSVCMSQCVGMTDESDAGLDELVGEDPCNLAAVLSLNLLSIDFGIH